jgi:hypothetical protein
MSESRLAKGRCHICGSCSRHGPDDVLPVWVFVSAFDDKIYGCRDVFEGSLNHLVNPPCS